MKFDKNDFVDNLGNIDNYTEFTPDRIIYFRYGTGFEMGTLPAKYYGARVYIDETFVGIVDDRRIIKKGLMLGYHIIQILTPDGELYPFIEELKPVFEEFNKRSKENAINAKV